VIGNATGAHGVAFICLRVSGVARVDDDEEMLTVLFRNFVRECRISFCNAA
jgi:hypothetical protein